MTTDLSRRFRTRALQPLSTRTIASHCGQPAATRNGSNRPATHLALRATAPPPTHRAPRTPPAPCQIPVTRAKSQLQPRFDPGERAISGSQPPLEDSNEDLARPTGRGRTTAVLRRTRNGPHPSKYATPSRTSRRVGRQVRRRPHCCSWSAIERSRGPELGRGQGNRRVAHSLDGAARLAGPGSRPRDPKRPPSPCRRQHACRRRSSPART
jgi:hypothetical protein